MHVLPKDELDAQPEWAQVQGACQLAMDYDNGTRLTMRHALSAMLRLRTLYRSSSCSEREASRSS
jgi:hypothetical protein